MENSTIGFLGFGVLLVFVASGMPIAFASALVGFLGIWFLVSFEAALTALGTIPHGVIAHYSLSVIPLFMLMGYLAYHSGLARESFWVARNWVGWLPGGLAVATVVGGAALGAVCGSHAAGAAILCRTAVPEMERYKYNLRLAGGTVAACGTLSTLIPPSALLVLYGIMTEQSVGKLLIAGTIPGLLVATIFGIQIVLRSWRDPTLGPRIPGVTWKERIVSLKSIFAFGIVACSIFGGIYSGVFTPTEAGGVSAALTLLIGIARRKMKLSGVVEALLEAGKSTCVVFIIIVGVLIFVRFLSLSRAPSVISEYVINLPVSSTVTLILILGIYFFLGMFMESIGMLMLTLPILYPASIALNYDPVWFGILVVGMCELGLLTPPVGVNIFVVKGMVPNISLIDLYRGAIPFCICYIFVMIALVAFPQLALYLPNLMR